MPAIQTTYSATMSPARAGQIANEEIPNLISRTVENAGGVAFGAAVAQGTNDKGCHTFTVGDTAFLGIAVRDRSVRPENNGDLFAQYDTARIATKGVIWVVAGESVAAGNPVYLTAADGTWKKTSASNVLVPNARWDTSASSGGFAQIRLA